MSRIIKLTFDINTIILFFIFFSIFLSPLFFKIFNIPLIMLGFFIAIIILLNKKIKLKNQNLIIPLFILIALYNCIVMLISLININKSSIKTGIPSDPIIPEYISIKQIILGLIYNNILFIFIFLFYFLVKNKRLWLQGEKIIYYLSIINSLFLIIELLIPNLHHKMLYIAGYENINYFFVPRPISLVLNSYVTAFISSFFSFWSFYYYIETKRKKFFLMFILGIIITILTGARFSIILLFISLILYNLFTKRYIFLLNLAILIFISTFIINYINPSYLDLLISIVKVSDSVGSADLHKILFLKTIEIIFNNPLGIGIGRADFGALNTIPNLAYDSESFLLTVLLQGGIISFVVYMLIHFIFIRTFLKKKLYHIASFTISILLVSLINIQILQSITMTSIIGFLYTRALIEEEFL
jgi:hypothetical protein